MKAAILFLLTACLLSSAADLGDQSSLPLRSSGAQSDASDSSDAVTQQDLHQLRREIERLEAMIAKLQSQVSALESRSAHTTTTPAPSSQSHTHGISSPTFPSSLQRYRVRSGDTLWQISRRHGISLTQLQNANPGLAPRRLRVGKELNIPGIVSQRSPSARPALARQSQTASRAPSSSTPAVQAVRASNPPPATIKPQLMMVRKDRRFSYLAELWGTDVATLNRLNNLNCHQHQLIKAGSQLYVPGL